METVQGHGATYKIELEEDGWWTIYKVHPETFRLVPVIQAADRDHAIAYIEKEGV